MLSLYIFIRKWTKQDVKLPNRKFGKWKLFLLWWMDEEIMLVIGMELCELFYLNYLIFTQFSLIVESLESKP